MQHHHHADTNGSYHFKHSHSSDIVLVFNADNYLMAEYTIRTGRTSWQRVAPVAQREAVEKWLGNNYPVAKTAATPAPAATKAKKTAKK